MLIGNFMEGLNFNDLSIKQSPLSYKDHFENLIKQIQLTNWKNHLTDSVKRYSLQTYKLTQLTPKNIEKLYEKVSLKYKNNERLRMTWYQNELRLFLWFLATSPGIFGILPGNYVADFIKQESQQLRQLSLPFLGIHQDLCEYQFKSIIAPHSFRAWEVEEDTLLGEILKKHSLEGAWSNIAKQLFLQSDKKYFRTPQTCRERWQNHLDDRKVRGQWTIEEDLLLIKFILSEGKRWSVIAKKIGDTRTEHMVKNRFQTILRREFKAKKKPVRFSQENEFCKDLVKKLSQQIIEESSKSQTTGSNFAPSSNSTFEISEDSFSPSLSKNVCPQTPSFTQNLPTLNLENKFSSETVNTHPCLSLPSLKQEQYQPPNNDNPSNYSQIGNQNLNNIYEYYSGFLQQKQKSFFDKMETQIELQGPMFIDEIIFGNQGYQMVEYFFKQSRQFE